MRFSTQALIKLKKLKRLQTSDLGIQTICNDFEYQSIGKLRYMASKLDIPVKVLVSLCRYDNIEEDL